MTPRPSVGWQPVGWQRLEGATVFLPALLIAIMMQPGWPIWVWPLALLLPDLSMLGYLAGPRAGAVAYNLAHLYGCGLILCVIGLVSGQPTLIAAGAIWMAHVGGDRALGYGLKEPGGFTMTHLGQIGKDRR